MKKITLGVLAHVDGGKTTLSEALLYVAGQIKKAGRVDHKDTVLDNFLLERKRGITIFSKQAKIKYNDVDLTLLDTPGHVDFSAEMERVLNVLDVAVLVINGCEGVQPHTETLWKLLDIYNIPTFIFVNKMDISNISRNMLLGDLRKILGKNIYEFSDLKDNLEDIAMTNEMVMDEFLETNNISRNTLRNLISMRNIFPCYFGSALNIEGVEEMLKDICEFSDEMLYNDSFAAKVFKISLDDKNNRMTHLKITGGKLALRDSIEYKVDDEIIKEKISEIRVYNGEKYDNKKEAVCGDVCQILGLKKTYVSQGLGAEKDNDKAGIRPVLSYKIELPDDVSVNSVYKSFKELEQEEPSLMINWNKEAGELTASVMGEIQIQVLKEIVKERMGIDIEFGKAKILYKETILNPVEGVGHFEPLRHYAEVHLLMEPLEPGAGLVFESRVTTNELSLNWQRLILTHLKEKTHRGVLGGFEITDMKISIVAGKAHLKHTEGGDFREATYRAVRQGLKMADSVLLEPYYDFVLKVPSDCVGRALNDISQKKGFANIESNVDDVTILKGYGPVYTMHDYITEVMQYTHGLGNLTFKFKGYAPAHNADEVLAEINYDSEADLENPCCSVFCAHGSGYNVEYDKVYDYMHIPLMDKKEKMDEEYENALNLSVKKSDNKDSYAMDKELMEIFEKTFGPVKRRVDTSSAKTIDYSKKKNRKPKKVEIKKKCLLVDGYNIIFAWDELKEIAKDNIDAARDKLLDIMANYQGFLKNTVIVVFDAYNVKRHKETVYKHGDVFVVYTKEAETADMYIAKTTKKVSKEFEISVATSDKLEQLIIMGSGAIRLSANNFKEEVDRVNLEIENMLGDSGRLSSGLFD